MLLDEYVTLGRTGLRVSRLCLGTMTFGTSIGWGSDATTSRAIFQRYVEAGGNFIDTADDYSNGESEHFVGKFIAECTTRDQIVLATKFTFNQQPGNPNAGGNGRKNIYRALESSLRRLGVDYIDLYWMHTWDMMTPIEEVLSTLDALVREGKIRYFGFSDVPAWYAARAQTLAEAGGLQKIAALQLEYSLVERSIEREHVPAARELGIGICPWSPLAGGFLSGKYREGAGGGSGRPRVNPAMNRFDTPRQQQILDALVFVAEELDCTPAEVALSWVASRPGVTSTIIGTNSLDQLNSNLASLDIQIPPHLAKRLTDTSALEIINPYRFFEEQLQSRVNGGLKVRGWSGRSQQTRSADMQVDQPKSAA